MLALHAAAAACTRVESLGLPLSRNDLEQIIATRLQTSHALIKPREPALPARLGDLHHSARGCHDDVLMGLWLCGRRELNRVGCTSLPAAVARRLRATLPREGLRALLDLDRAQLELALSSATIVDALNGIEQSGGLADNHLHSGGATDLGDIIATLLPRLGDDIEPRDIQGLVGLDEVAMQVNLMPLLLGVAVASLLLYAHDSQRVDPGEWSALAADFDDEWWRRLRSMARDAHEIDPAAFQAHRSRYVDACQRLGRSGQLSDLYRAFGLRSGASPAHAAVVRRGLVSLSALHVAVASPVGSSLGAFVPRFDLLRRFRGSLGPVPDRIERTLRDMYFESVRICELRKSIGAAVAPTVSVAGLVADIKEDLREHAGAAVALSAMVGAQMTVRMPVTFIRESKRRDVSAEPSTYAQFREPVGHALALADAIATIARAHASTRRFMGAVDVVGDERSVPNWVFALAYERLATLTDASCELEYACHVGEYYSHKLEGLRRIGELALFSTPVRRAGHCLALSRTARSDTADGLKAAVVLEDLIWTRMTLSGDARVGLGPVGVIPGLVNIVSQIDQLLSRLSPLVFGDFVPTDDLCLWYTDRFTLSRVAAIVPGLDPDADEPNAEWPDGLDSDWIKLADLRTTLLYVTVYDADAEIQTSSRVSRWRFDRHRDCPLDVAAEAEQLYDGVLGPLRELVMAYLARTGTVVETCPSSNAALGEITMEEHPVFDLRGTLHCSVSTDDPSIFGANLREEYLQLGAAAVRNGSGPPQALITELAEASRTVGAVQTPLCPVNRPPADVYAEVLRELS